MIRKYWHIAKAEFHHELSHTWNAITWVGILFVILFVFLQIWKTVYGTKDTLEGYTIAQMIWYLAMAEVITFANGSHNIEDIEKDIQSGTFSLSLIKPVNFVGMWIAKLFGYSTMVLLSFGTFAVFFAYSFVGSIPFNVATIPIHVLTITLALLMNYLFVVMYGLIALWLERVEAFGWIHTKFTFILGGMFMPFEVYPVWIQPFLHALPFGYMMYGPAKLFVHFSLNEFYHLLFGQIAWIIILTMTVLFMFKKGVREVSVHGG